MKFLENLCKHSYSLFLPSTQVPYYLLSCHLLIFLFAFFIGFSCKLSFLSLCLQYLFQLTSRVSETFPPLLLFIFFILFFFVLVFLLILLHLFVSVYTFDILPECYTLFRSYNLRKCFSHLVFPLSPHSSLLFFPLFLHFELYVIS